MSINRLSGYLELPLSTGQTVALKFCNGSTSIFAALMGFTTLEEINQALTAHQSISHQKALRLYVYSAAKYVCLAENLPETFNEWQAQEWIDEVGIEAVFNVIEWPEPKPQETTSFLSHAPQTLTQYKANALSRLNITPTLFYDLTPAETSALLEGVQDREVMSWQQTRVVALLIRNAHYTKPMTAEQFMPLPGDNAKPFGIQAQYTDPEVAFHMLCSAMGGSPEDITVEYHGYAS